MGAAIVVSLPSPGDLFEGKYVIERVLGEGGMGIVYEASHRRLEQRVAIKMLRPELMAVREVVDRFEREARASAKLKSRHTVRVVDVGERSDGLPYIVMEFLEGTDLDVELQRVGRLPISDAVDYVLEACEAMVEAHACGIVHRDLKPSNLFLAHEGSGRVLKVLDFGISKVDRGASRVTSTNTSMGTPLYMSPEQLRSAKTVDARSDIWALGIVLYELLTGDAPFSGDAASVGAAIVTDTPAPLASRRRDIPAALEAVVFKALEKNRDHRYQDVRAFAEALVPFGTRKAPSDHSLHTPARVMVTTAPGTPRVSPEDVTQFAPESSDPAVSDRNAVTGRDAREKATVPGWTTATSSGMGGGRGKIVTAAIFLSATVMGAGIWMLTRGSSTSSARPVEPAVATSVAAHDPTSGPAAASSPASASSAGPASSPLAPSPTASAGRRTAAAADSRDSARTTPPSKVETKSRPPTPVKAVSTPPVANPARL